MEETARSRAPRTPEQCFRRRNYRLTQTLAGAVLSVAAISSAPAAHAAPNVGDICYSWNVSVPDGNGGTLTCKHLADSGHLMYWEYGGPEPDYTR